MPIYHLHTSVISRNKGRSSVAAASYRSAQKLYDERQEMSFDFTRKQSVDFSNIMLPGNAPVDFLDREKLWNAVEQAETRCNSRTAREVEVAIPVELNFDMKKKLVHDFVKDNFVNKGMCADYSIHNAQGENPHCHIMLTTREVDSTGFTDKNRDWDKKETLECWRKNWEVAQNKFLQNINCQERVSCMSYKDQGLDYIPTPHLGRDHEVEQKHKQKCEREGIEYAPITERGIEREAIREQNRILRKLKELQKQRIKLQQSLRLKTQEMQHKISQQIEKTNELRQIFSQQIKHRLEQIQQKKEINIRNSELDLNSEHKGKPTLDELMNKLEQYKQEHNIRTFDVDAKVEEIKQSRLEESFEQEFSDNRNIGMNR